LQKHLFLTNPKGIIQLQGKHGTKQTIHFDAGELFWDHLGQSLTLKDNVNIDQDQVFHLNTNHELTIHQNLIDGQKFLRSIISPKNTTMFYEDLQKELIHKIMSPGKLVVDHEHLITTMEGLKDKDGRLILGQQVYFEDSGGDMYADHVQISYEWNNQQLIPTKIILNGNIKLMNRFDGHSQQINSILHYAMADQVEYFPHLQKVILSGQNGHRVLFFDKVNNVQISAPAIKIQKNKEDNKFSVQGIGDVRFTFIETELSQFKERFNLDQNTN
jgi:lipopolysaccharide export system protein LptA